MTSISDADELLFQELITAVEKKAKLQKGYTLSFKKHVLEKRGRKFLFITVERSNAGCYLRRLSDEIGYMDGVPQKFDWVGRNRLPFPSTIDTLATYVAEELKRDDVPTGAW